LGSGIEERQQFEKAEERRLTQQEPFDRQAALERVLRDLNIERGTLESGRRLEDITTDARRLAENQQFLTDQEREKAQRDKEKAELAADRAGYTSDLSFSTQLAEARSTG